MFRHVRTCTNVYVAERRRLVSIRMFLPSSPPAPLSAETSCIEQKVPAFAKSEKSHRIELRAQGHKQESYKLQADRKLSKNVFLVRKFLSKNAKFEAEKFPRAEAEKAEPIVVG